MLEITVLMLGGVSQQHKILLDLIIKYTAKLAEMLKSELSWGFFLFCFYTSVVLVLSAPEAAEHSSRGLSHPCVGSSHACC